MAQPDMICVRITSACKGQATCSEAGDAPASEYEFAEGDTFRGWIVNHPNPAEFVVLTGGSDIYIIPRSCCELSMRGDNPILDGQVSPKEQSNVLRR